MFSSTFSLLLLALVLSAADAAPQNSNGDTLNATIPAYTDSILSAVAASPPTNASAADVQFLNGPRTLGGAYVHFTERDGTDGNGHVGVVLELSVPHNLSSTNNVFSWAVHENAIAPGDNACTSAGARWDPFGANSSAGYHPTPGNLSTYAAGDLSGKWGLLSTSDGRVQSRKVVDHYLRLTGNFSVVGRSVVLLDAPSGVPLACGNISHATRFEVSPSGYAPAPSASSSHHKKQKNGAASRATGASVGAGVLGLAVLSLGVLA